MMLIQMPLSNLYCKSVSSRGSKHICMHIHSNSTFQSHFPVKLPKINDKTIQAKEFCGDKMLSSAQGIMTLPMFYL